jgi:3-oxoadipate enol-lactonase
VSLRIAWERRGSGDPLVLVHGLGYARWGWEPVVDALAERFELILFDNRGVGESDVPPGPYTAGDMAGDVVQVMDEAAVERAHVLGTSLGGMIAQELALTRPDRVERLVLACTTPGGTGAFPLPEGTLRLIAEAPTLEPAVALRRFVENALGPAAVEERPELVERILAHRLGAPQNPAGWAAQAAAGTTFDRFADMGRIAAPTLVQHGTEDRVVDVRNAGLLGDHLPDAQVQLFAGAGHLYFWEQPERFVASVTAFLAEAA